MCVIRTENLCKTYRGGTQALCGLDLEVHSGEVFGFLGPNGAGKSTTIQLVLNFIRPTTGTASLFGRPAADPRTRQRLGYLPESVNLHAYYSGRGLLEFYAGLLGVERADRRRRAEELLERVGLRDAAGRKISQYSKGMLQRLGLAQALINDPELLILDEPTSNLDPVARRDFRDILLELKASGTTVFICSHILSEVESVCDRVAILQQGVLKRAGTLEELSGTAGATVMVKDLPAGVIEALSATEARLTLRKGQSTIACDSQTVLRDVERVLEQWGVEVERVETRMQSLEEIFFGAIDPERTS
ncbi:MAG: ABC transporter ATP-binding protein [Bryobacterales bacterium]|nr:ABC transporter ATP-binding protein [Bryobacterales bacterium]